MKKKLGVSYLELIIVLGILAIISIGMAPFVINFSAKRNLDSTRDMVLSAIKQAQFNSLTNKGDTSWGVCIEENNIKIYSGNCSISSNSTVYSYSESVSISGITDVVFSQSRGEPNTPLSIVLSNQFGEEEIYVNSVGGITY